MAKGDNNFQIGWLFSDGTNHTFIVVCLESRINHTNLSNSVRISVGKNSYLASICVGTWNFVGFLINTWVMNVSVMG